MLNSGFISTARVLGFLMVGAACLPAVAHAQADSMTRVERTPAYDVMLLIGPAQEPSPLMAMQPDQSADMAMGHGPGMLSDQADQGMAVNHRLEVRITQATSGSVVTDVTPSIRVTDRSTGESRDLAQIMGMNTGMGAEDFRYGQNVFLPDGTYWVTVQLGRGETAQFRDVMVVAS